MSWSDNGISEKWERSTSIMHQKHTHNCLSAAGNHNLFYGLKYDIQLLEDLVLLLTRETDYLKIDFNRIQTAG